MEKSSPIYIPTGLRAADRWEIVRDALIDQGFTNIKPAPLPSMAFVPRALRQEAHHG